MALSILDGNQSATTLSTIVSSGQHIPSHTVVSLGSQAISNITSAISGTSVCVGNLGLLQSTVGTEGITANTNFIKIGGHTGTSTTGNIVHVSSVGALRVDGSVYTQPVSIASVTIGNTVTIAGTVTIGTALPAGTNRIGVVTIGGGTVTLGLGTQRIGSVTALGSRVNYATDIAIPVGLQGDTGFGYGYNDNAFIPIRIISNQTGTAIDLVGNETGGKLPISGSVTIGAGTAQIGSVTASLQASSITGGLKSLTYQDIASVAYLNTAIGSLPALAAGTAQIGSVTASISNSVTIGSLPAISGTVTANTFAVQGTAVTTSNFTSTTASTVLANYDATREVLTIFNEGAGNLHICAGATCTTIAYQVRLSAGDYYEVPNHQTTITHSAVFATAGTARVCQVS